MLLPRTTSLGGLVDRTVDLEAGGCMFEPYDGHFLIIEERGGWEIMNESKKSNLLWTCCYGVCFPQIGKEWSTGF